MRPDVSAYYNQTQNHYKRWWKLDKAMALHYGLWLDGTKTFAEALANTNRYMANQVGVKPGDEVLDAGCGVGGSSIFIANRFNAKVTGITLSELQVATAKNNAAKFNCIGDVNFELMNYCSTSFASDSFDIIWACESSSSAPDKQKMLKEWYRILKPGGRLIILDFFSTAYISDSDPNWLEKWTALWAMSRLVSIDNLSGEMQQIGYQGINIDDLSIKVWPTIKRMYQSYWLGALPSKLYNLIFGAREYARNHYKSGFYQYKAYKNNQWKYFSILAQKPKKNKW